MDFTIADFVADIRAATPTRAAEIIVDHLEDLSRRLYESATGLHRDILRHLRLAETRLGGLMGSSGLARVPQRVKLYRERLRRAMRLGPALRRVATTASLRLEHAARSLRRLPAKIAAGGHRRLLVSRKQQIRQLMTAHIGRRRAGVDAASRALDHLGPTRVLERGYSITTLEGNARPLKDAANVHGGQTLTTRLAHGEVRSLVSSTSTGKLTTKRDPAAQPSLFDEASDSGPGTEDRSDQ